MIILGSFYGRTKPLIETIMMNVIRKEAFEDSLQACSIVTAGLSENIGDIAAFSLAITSNEN